MKCPPYIKYPIRRPSLPVFWLVTFHPYFKVKQVKLTKKMPIISLSWCEMIDPAPPGLWGVGGGGGGGGGGGWGGGVRACLGWGGGGWINFFFFFEIFFQQQNNYLAAHTETSLFSNFRTI